MYPAIDMTAEDISCLQVLRPTEASSQPVDLIFNCTLMNNELESHVTYIPYPTPDLDIFLLLNDIFNYICRFLAVVVFKPSESQMLDSSGTRKYTIQR